MGQYQLLAFTENRELGTELRDLAALVEHAEKFGDQLMVPESGAGFIAHGDGGLFVI